MKIVTVTVEIEVPDNATNQDIREYVDVEYGQCNGMKADNPCKDCEVIYHNFKVEAETD